MMKATHSDGSPAGGMGWACKCSLSSHAFPTEKGYVYETRYE